MPWFVKTETLSHAFLAASRAERSARLAAHRDWVATLRAQGRAMASGFLVDAEHRPGGGGLLLLRASSYAAALALVQRDPLIRGGWVTWQLHEWVAAVGDLAVGAADAIDPPGDDQRG